MPRPTARLVIDARPRGPRGPMAGELVQGRCVLGHLLDLAQTLDDEGPLVIHARLEEHARLGALIADRPSGRFVFATGPPPEHSTILRADRLYDPSRLRRAFRRGKDPESAVIWRLDQPHGLSGAEAELTRRQSYQPMGRFWALAPARGLAIALRRTPVRPNALTVASASLVVVAAVAVACGASGLAAHAAEALALAVALVLDTADGHLARLQGTASEFGRWLDASLDELGDMALHGAVAWAAFARDGRPAWLVLGMLYAMGKYLFVVTTGTGDEGPRGGRPGQPSLESRGPSLLTSCVRLAGHADVRWHLWIVLAALGRLDAALAAYAAYFPARALGSAWRRAARHA